MPFRTLLVVFAAPLLISALASAISLWKERRLTGPSAWGAIGLAAAYCAAQWGLLGMPTWPPRDCVDQLADGVLGAALLEIILQEFSAPRSIALGLRGAFWLAMVAALVRRLAGNSWSPGEAGVWIGGMTVGGWVWLAALAQAGSTRPEPALGRFSLGNLTLLNFAVIALGSAIVLGLSGSATLALLQTALLVAVLPSLILALKRSELAALLADSQSVAISVALLGAWIAGFHFASLPAGSAVALWLAPLAGWFAARLSRDWRPGMRAGLVCGVNLALVAVAIAVAISHFEPPTPGGYDYGGRSGATTWLQAAHFVKNRTQQRCFEGRERAGDRRAVEHAMIVDDAHVDFAVGVNHAIVEHEG
jgi:hypothetical protein